MKSVCLTLAALLLTPLVALHADSFLVKDGQPRAQIIIAENPPHTVRLAAQDLQTYVEKISGAHLPIVTKPSEQATKVFIGRSQYTDRLKITPDGLKAGAYRMVS